MMRILNKQKEKAYEEGYKEGQKEAEKKSELTPFDVPLQAIMSGEK